MSIEAWIIDELEEEAERDKRSQPSPELDPPRRPEESSQPSLGGPRRGVRILEISPTSDNVIDL
jgi:hypothetical protein